MTREAPSSNVLASPLAETLPPISGFSWEQVTTEALREVLLPEDEGLRQSVMEVVSTVSLLRLAQRFAQTDEGAHLHGMMRFNTKYQPEHMPNDAWLHILGRQASDLWHGDYTMMVSQQILEHEADRGLTEDETQLEQFLFGFSNLTHDWGEADPDVGDPPFGSIKPHVREERAMHRRLAKAMLEETVSEQNLALTQDIHEAIDWIVDWSDRLAFDKPTEKQLTFNGDKPDGFIYYSHLYRSVKYHGHFVVALRVGRFLENNTSELLQQDRVLLHNLNNLHTQVTYNALPVVIEYAPYVKAMDLFLRSRMDEIDYALGQACRSNPTDTLNYNKELPLELDEVVERWLEYRRSASKTSQLATNG